MHAAGSLFRGAGYTAFDGSVPDDGMQAAVVAHYAHVTAPLRRLVDRFALVACEAISTGQPVPQWVRDALPTLPAVMAASDQTAGALDRASLDTVEAAALSSRVGDIFDATVISAGNGRGKIQLTDPAVTASCTGAVEPGTRIRARLVEATIATGAIRFEAVVP
jgi:exoribonuclease R